MAKSPYATMTSAQLMAELKKSPRKIALNYHVSRRLFKEGKRDLALPHALRALESAKPKSSYYAQAAQCLTALGMPKSAEILVRDAMTKGVQTHQMYFRLAQAMARQKLISSAVQSMDYALSLKPNAPAYMKYRDLLTKMPQKKA